MGQVLRDEQWPGGTGWRGRGPPEATAGSKGREKSSCSEGWSLAGVEDMQMKVGEARLENCKWQFGLDLVNIGAGGFEQF